MLTRRQQLEKLLAIAAEKKKLQAHVRYLKACNVAQMADKECASVEVSSAVAGNEINAKEYTAVLSAACDSKDLMRAYYTEALDTPEQADAAIAIMESGLRNMRSYMDTGTKCGFRYSPLCFASAIDMFSRMSTTAYAALRSRTADLPSEEYVRKVVNRHAHQPSGVLRGDIRDWSTFLFRKGGFSVEEKRTSN